MYIVNFMILVIFGRIVKLYFILHEEASIESVIFILYYFSLNVNA